MAKGVLTLNLKPCYRRALGLVPLSHCTSTRTSSSSRGCGKYRSAPAAPSRAPSVRFAHLHSKATAPAARRRAPAEAAHGTQLEGPNCAVPQKRPRKIKCPYACLRIRWHGSPCRPAVREVVHQLSMQGLRVRGSRAGLRSCAASAPGAAALPAAHASVKPALSRWRAPFRFRCGARAEFAVVLPLRHHLNVFWQRFFFWQRQFIEK